MDGTALVSGANRLLLGPLPEGGDVRSHFERTSESDRSLPSVIVSTRQPPAAIRDSWRIDAESDATEPTIIAVNETTRSPVRRSGGADEFGGPVTEIRTDDLTGLGIAINESLSTAESDAPLVWFDSVTTLVHATGFEQVFRFLHVLIARIERARAVAYYLVDPAAHDPQTITSLTYLVDDVIDVD